MAGGVHGQGGYAWPWGLHGEGDACVVKGAGMAKGKHTWQRGDAWQKGDGHACQERQPLQRAVHILLECILVVKYF